MVVGKIQPRIYMAQLDEQETPQEEPTIPKEQPPPTPSQPIYYFIQQENDKIYIIAVVGLIALALVICALHYSKR